MMKQLSTVWVKSVSRPAQKNNDDDNDDDDDDDNDDDDDDDDNDNDNNNSNNSNDNYKLLPSWVRVNCKPRQSSVCFFLSFSLSFFLCYKIFSQTIPHFSISFCRHLEHCQVRIEFAFGIIGSL
jgi:hypothetical protein